MIDRKIESALILVGVMALGGWTGWARTEVTTRLEVDELCIRARCFETAVKQLDFKHEVPDFIWGNDSVEFFVDDGSGVRVMKRGLLDEIWSEMPVEWTETGSETLPLETVKGILLRREFR